MKFSKKPGTFFFFSFWQQGYHCVSSWKAKLPCFLCWHTVWPAQLRAEEHKPHSQLHTWSHRKGCMDVTQAILLWQKDSNSLDPAENPDLLVRALHSIHQPNSLDFNGSVKLMDACYGLGPNRWTLSSAQAFRKKGEFTCRFSLIFDARSTVFAQLLQKANRALMSWCLNQKL